MKKYLLLLLLISSINIGRSQEIIKVPHEIVAGTNWEGGEKTFFSDIWQTQVVTNVSVPTMEVFRPKSSVANGTAVIVAPGGGLYALSIQSEGTDVAKWLNQKGITAFVLKYRLVPTGEDGVKEITDEGANNPARIGERVAPVLPLSISDGLEAINYVRTHAETLGVDPNKIGFMGFSAGGAVTMGVTFNYGEEDEKRPDFIVPVYAWMDVVGAYKVPSDAPPMLAICASDDPLQLAPASVALYSAWLKDGKKAELHMYSKGGHGFGMKTQGLASDHWIDRFYDWSVTEGITIPSLPE